MTHTIAAVASAPGAGDRAVVRVSGPLAGAILREICRGARAADPLAAGRGAEHVRVLLPGGEIPAWLLWMPGPRSVTGEDVGELHLPGHPGLVDEVLECLFRSGARPAQAGEFTRRAFENGRIDLTRAEGVAALVAARSADERRAAIALLSGGLERRIDAIRGSLESARSLAEASLDFDETDTGHVPLAHIEALVEEARARLGEAFGWERHRARRPGVPRIVLAGAPNAGKSTLFNLLASGALRDAAGPALVSDVAGTTRDPKRGAWMLVPGVEAELTDTAGRGQAAPPVGAPNVPSPGQSEVGSPGEHPSEDWSEVERAAEQRAADQISAADLVLLVVDASDPRPARPADLDPSRTALLWNKTDIGAPGPPEDLAAGLLDSRALSARDLSGADPGAGRAELGRWCARLLGLEQDAAAADARGPGAAASPGENRISSRISGLGARHLAALEAADGALLRGLEAARAGEPLDLVAEELRAATHALDGIVGRTTPEDLLTRIFAAFCLGK